MNNLNNEYMKMENELSEIRIKMQGFRKGNLRKKTIKGREYTYLQFREKGHVRSVYVPAESIENVCVELEQRKELEQSARELQQRLEKYAVLMGKHRTYRPVKKVDYGNYTLFMSKVAHDFKLLEWDAFIEKYKASKYRGLEKRYLLGFYDFVNGIDRCGVRRTNDLILDPYTYLMYYKYGQKEILKEELKHAVPAFLNHGLLITNVQEAVNGAYSKRGISL